MFDSAIHLAEHLDEVPVILLANKVDQVRSWYETYEQLLADSSAFEDFDLDTARTQGYGFARIQRLAIEHLLGVR